MESGNAIIAKRIGLEIIEIPKMRFQFCMYPSLKMLNKYLDVAVTMRIIQRIKGEIENQ